MTKPLLTLQESLASVAKGDPVYMRWDDYRGAFKWVSGSENAPGTNRIEYPAVEAPMARGRLIVLPTGQSAAKQTRDTDTVYLGIEGDVEFTVGANRLVLKPLDIVSIPAGSSYSYVNLGLANAQLCGIYAKEDGSPSAPGAAKAAIESTHMRWQEYRRDFHWTLPLAEHWGYHRGSGPLIITNGLRGHTVRMPTGQTTPWHFAARDMLFMGISDEVEFKAGGKAMPLGPRDWIIVPAGTPYTYTNYGLAECVFFSIGGKLPPGKKGTYFSEDPGWPIRADAPTMVVEIDAHGDARVVSGSPIGKNRPA